MPTIVTNMATWEAKPNQSMAFPNDTWLVNFGQLVCEPTTHYQQTELLPYGNLAQTMRMKFSKAKWAKYQVGHS